MDFHIRPTSEFKKLSMADTFQLLHSDEKGLSTASVQERISFFGRNEIPEKRKNPFIEFVGRYWGPMPWLLELAMLLSFALKHELEGCIIFGLMTLNAIIGFMHSRTSQKAVELLKQRLAIQAKVLRNGNWVIEDAASISVLCLDKTGTITQNKLEVTDVIPFSGWSIDEAIRTALMSSRIEEMDLIDLAIFDYAKRKEISLNPYKEISYTAPKNLCKSTHKALTG
jgi:magnesium-transporting ATPase (P-type)